VGAVVIAGNDDSIDLPNEFVKVGNSMGDPSGGTKPCGHLGILCPGMRDPPIGKPKL
jgi:hypothetical protein